MANETAFIFLPLYAESESNYQTFTDAVHEISTKLSEGFVVADLSSVNPMGEGRDDLYMVSLEKI